MTTTTKKMSTGARVAVGIILLVVILLVIEGLLSIYLYQRYGPDKLASIEILKTVKNRFNPRVFPLDDRAHNLVRPDSSKAVNRKIAEEAMESNRFVQESWIEFRNMDFNGTYMHMTGSTRKTVPDVFANPESKDTIDIYFFGGSTMFGFNVMDNETIPSQFVALYKERFPKGKNIRVHNYGTPTYYSYQELMLLSDLIYNGHHPDIAVFLDGINDFWFATAAYYRQSYFSYVFRQVFDKGLPSNGNFQLVDTADNMFMDPKNIPLDQYNSKLVANYFENIENVRMMCDMAGIKSHFFLQPSPFYNYGNQQNDPICFKDTNTRFNYIYPLVKQQGDAHRDFVFLGDMLEHETGYPFIDGLHYSPAFIKKLTGRMLDELELNQ
jgi:hypothetical protein